MSHKPDKRQKAAIDASNALQRDVRSLQQSVFAETVAEVAGRLEVENGKIKFTARNMGAAGWVYRVFDRFKTSWRGTLLGTILDWAGDIAGLNEEYYSDFGDAPTKERALEYAMLRWGYDIKTGSVLPGGYLEGLFDTGSVAKRAASLVSKAIAQGMSLKQFQAMFASVFVGRPGKGMLEAHWRTNSFDLFQRIDRAANLFYADELGLNWAVYSGTLEEDSRPFCIARVNKVYSRKQIESWKGLEFQGKPKYGYDPFTDCGGFNCRHHLSWVSDEIAQHLKK